MEKTIELEIPLLLPNVKDEQDECLNRLEVSLQNQRGILRAHLEREKTPVDLCLHYDPNLLTLEQVKRLAQRAGAGIANRYHHLFTPIEGMDCSDCVTVIEHGLGRMDGVLAVNVNYAAASLRVEYDKHKVDRPAIEKRVQSLGYEIPAEGFRSWYKENREIVFSLTAGLLLIIGWLGETFFGLPAWIATTLYIGGYVFGGWDISQHAWHAIKEKHFDTDLLMVMAALGAAFLGEFAEGALLLFLFSLGHALEERALDRARAAVRALADLAPKTALVRRDGKEQELPVESLQLEDVVIVRPGVRIPVDGVILIGNSGVDQASVTGESLPVDKVPGDQVFASTVNGEGALEVKVTRLAKDSTLARVMKMVEEAQAQKSPTQQTVEKFERVFVPAVLIVTALVIIVPPMFGFPFHESFLRAMSLLVAASPCALALGTPATILAGVAQAARNGVLVKGGAHLENLGRLKAIAFDKTGTVTHGRPEVTDLVVFPDSGWKEDDVVSLVAGAESRSAHPLAQAVVRSAQSLPVSVMDEVESLTGRGLRAISNGKTIWIGNRKLMDEAMVTIPSDALQKADALQQSGKTLMWIAEDKTVIGLIALADTLRHEAAPTMKALKQTGVAHTIMLTGDNTRSASAIAKEIGLTEYRADLMPEDKLTVIRDLVREYGQVAMIGDGVNDAPALANATVGIAMGGAGTDVALETADVALMQDDLRRIPLFIALSRKTSRVLKQNITLSIGIKVVFLALNFTGLATLWMAVFADMGASLIVVFNGLRLLRTKEQA